jgi:hypothetical protein
VGGMLGLVLAGISLSGHGDSGPGACKRLDRWLLARRVSLHCCFTNAVLNGSLHEAVICLKAAAPLQAPL